jgi:hypothetical protein
MRGDKVDMGKVLGEFLTLRFDMSHYAERPEMAKSDTITL